MHDHSEDHDLAACTRRARRWSLGLICVLAINFSLVALALGGFGNARPSGESAAKAPTLVADPGNSVEKGQAATKTTPQSSAVAEKTAAKISVALENTPAPEPFPAPTPIVLPPVVDPPPPVLPPDPSPAPSPPATRIPVMVEPPAAIEAAPPPAAESLIIINRRETGGPVSFAAAGRVESLEPGQYCELAGDRSRRVEYHRGDSFGYASHDLEAGCYAFEVGEQGWTLKPLEPAAARKLLETCVRLP